jgi:hypothetical protein
MFRCRRCRISLASCFQCQTRIFHIVIPGAAPAEPSQMSKVLAVDKKRCLDLMKRTGAARRGPGGLLLLGWLWCLANRPITRAPGLLGPSVRSLVPEAQALLRGRGPHYGTGAAQVHTVSALGLTTPGGDAVCRTGGIELGELYGCWDTGGGLDGKELLIERGLRWSSE